MVTNFNDLDLTKQYTYADYLTWQFAERVELFKGWVAKMSPAPSSNHQQISFNLSGEFRRILKKQPCKAFAAPFDVRLITNKKDDKSITTVVQPDLCIICDTNKIDEKGCLGAPDLIIEIISKGNTKKELEKKFELYEENGVKEYWIIHQNDETIVVFDLINNKYQLRKIYSNDSIVPVGILEGFSIDMEEVFE
jgi:Uma2 family endonuclease